MIEIILEHEVKNQYRGQFELAFGPGGLWSEMFAHAPGFRGTTLLRDEKNPRRYLTIDLWDSETQRTQWLIENESEFAALQASFTDWSESKVELGIFRMLAEGTVRPRGSGRRRQR
jgi:heme-degrading monooxygenase HmoA